MTDPLGDVSSPAPHASPRPSAPHGEGPRISWVPAAGDLTGDRVLTARAAALSSVLRSPTGAEKYRQHGLSAVLDDAEVATVWILTGYIPPKN